MMHGRLAVAAVAMVAVIGTATGSATAQTAAPQSGKDMTFIVGFGVGGTYNAYSRLVAGHIGNFLPGKPNVIVQNMPGANSVIATNFLYEIAPKDGSTIGMIDQAIQSFQLMGRKGLKADASKFNWLGRVISNSAILFASKEAPIKKIEDAFEQEFIVSSSGAASRLNWMVMNQVLGAKLKMITGYKGTADAFLAMQRGEIHGLSRPWTALKAEQADWIKEGKIVLLLQTGAQKNDDLQHLPRIIDLARNDDDRRLLEFFAAPSEVGRSVVAPPGVSAEKVAQLRAAFWSAIQSPAFQKDLKKSRLEIEPMKGEKLQALVESGKDVPQAIVDRAKKLAAAASKQKKK